MIWTVLGSVIGSALANIAVNRWQDRRGDRLEHNAWNEMIMSDVAGPVYLDRNDRSVLDLIEFENPDMDEVLWDDSEDDEG